MENTDRSHLPAPGSGYPQPYYPDPGLGHPGPTAANWQSPPQQQQQQVFVVNNQLPGVAPLYVVGAPSASMAGAIGLSCFVFWCCGWLFGGIAFILAMVGQSSAASGDARSAIQLRNASYGLSIAGIVFGIITIAVVAGILGSAASTYKSCGYYKNGYFIHC